jgi:altronate dehydratase small subunit
MITLIIAHDFPPKQSSSFEKFFYSENGCNYFSSCPIIKIANPIPILSDVVLHHQTNGTFCRTCHPVDFLHLDIPVSPSPALCIRKGGLSMSAYRAIMMQPHDNVATALEPIPADSRVTVACLDVQHTVTLPHAIEFGHKFAVRPIGKGEDIVKYGEVIGVATRDIAPGEHVHVHNLEGKRGRGDKIAHEA